MNRVVVIGGGLVGSSAAYHAACQGAERTLVDRADQGQATAAGAGILSPGSGFRDADAELLDLVAVAAAWYPELLARLAEDGEILTGYEAVGALHVATSEPEADQLSGLLEQLRRRRAGGFSHIGEAALVDAPAARARFPALGPVHGAVHIPGATREHGAGYDHRVTAAGMHEVLGEALRLAPGLAAATVVEVRVGFRPASPDGKPILGPLPGIANLYLATGHGPYGLQVGPWSGAAIADLALGRPVQLDLGPFTVARFRSAARGRGSRGSSTRGLGSRGSGASGS